MLLAAFAQAFAAVLGLGPAPPPDPVSGLTPLEKARLVVVSGLPAPDGVGGVFVHRAAAGLPRPRGALVFVDQEGGDVRAFPGDPPARWASSHTTAPEAFAAGRETGRALRRRGIHVDLAPVLDAPSGPLGARHFRTAALGRGFARGLAAEGVDACAKHFPGLGTAAASTDVQVNVPARIVPAELAGFRAAVADGIACVMTSHAVYPPYGTRAVTAPEAYATLRRWGFDGVVVTDSLNVVASGPWSTVWARRAARAGADLLLFTSPEHARRAIRALVPLARRGELDEAVRRVLELRAAHGLPQP